jgi:hypothetical protein
MDKFLSKEPPKNRNTAAVADVDGATTDSTASSMKGKKNKSFNAGKQNLAYQIARRTEAISHSARNPRTATEHCTKDRNGACFHIAKREAGSCRCGYADTILIACTDLQILKLGFLSS